MTYIIRVPEPCHEDWNKMLPEEKGRHCNVCSKTVIDFSKKTDHEINNILEENKGISMCGHFKASQLNRPITVRIPIMSLPGKVSRMHAFAIAVFFAFGTFLFSCTDNIGRNVGEIKMELPEEIDNSYTLGEPLYRLAVDTPQIEEKIADCMVDGEMMVQETMVNGGMSYENVIIDPVGSFIDADTTIISEPNMNEYAIVGMIAPEPPNVIVDDIDSIAADSSVIERIAKTTPGSTIKVFPNPSTGEFNINYELKKKSSVQIEIIDMTGSVIKSVAAKQDQHSGRYVLPVDLNEAASGIYFCRIVIDGKEQHKEIVITK